MRLLKKNPVLSIFNEFLVDSPLPSNINYLYGFGSLLGLILGMQILTGVFLAMHYAPHIDLAFNSVEHNDVFF
jgi:ubiquinol-cytochrome c reductase cytochrome b subunit